MPDDQLDGLLNWLVSGTGEITSAEREQLRSAIFGTPDDEKSAGVADIAAELDAVKDGGQDDEAPCELQSAEDYLARVAAQDQPVPASLLRLVGAAPAIRSPARPSANRSRLAGLSRKHVLPWGSAIAATVLAGISGYWVHDLIDRNSPAPANITAPTDLASAPAPETERNAVVVIAPPPPQDIAPSPNSGAASSTPSQPPAVGAAKKGDVPKLRDDIGKLLNDAIKLTYAGNTSKNGVERAQDFAGALAKIREADAVKDKTPYEEYEVAKLLGFIAINQPVPDYAAATAAYNRQVASGGAPEAEKASIYKVAMRLNYQERNFSETIRDGVALQMLQPFNDTEYLVMLQSYYSTNDFANAVDMAKKEIAARAAAGLKPSPDVLGILQNAEARINAQSSRAPARGLQTKNEALVKAITDMNNAAKAQNWAVALEKAKEADAIKDDKPAALNAPIHAMIITAAINAHDYAAALAQLDQNIATGEGNKAQNLKQALAIATMWGNQQKIDQYSQALSWLAAGITPPVATTIHAVTADDYPPVSIRLEEQGKVQIKYLVKEDGSVGDCNVITSSGKTRLDDAACAMAVNRWKFKPATQNGKPVAEYLTAEVVFQLK